MSNKEYFESFDNSIICNTIKSMSIKFKKVKLMQLGSNTLYIEDEHYAHLISSKTSFIFGDNEISGLYESYSGFILVLPTWVSMKINYVDDDCLEGTLTIKTQSEEGYTSEPEC